MHLLRASPKKKDSAKRISVRIHERLPERLPEIIPDILRERLPLHAAERQSHGAVHHQCRFSGTNS